jgi:hypothetical protein
VQGEDERTQLKRTIVSTGRVRIRTVKRKEKRGNQFQEALLLFPKKSYITNWQDLKPSCSTGLDCKKKGKKKNPTRKQLRGGEKHG